METHAASDAAHTRAPASLADERTPMLLAQARDTLEAYASASPGSFEAGPAVAPRDAARTRGGARC